MRTTDGMATDPLQATFDCGTVTVLVGLDAITLLLEPDYLDRDYALAVTVMRDYPHDPYVFDTMYCFTGADALIFLRTP